MKAAIINAFGGYDVFNHTDVPDPEPRTGYAIVKVLACGINRYDLFLRMGGVKKPTPLPHVMGADISGEVVEISGDAHGFSPGDRVIVAPGFPIDPADWDAAPETLAPSYTVTGTTEWGGYAQFVRVPTRYLLADRTNLSPEQVAAIPLVLVTAVHAVRTLGNVKPSNRVLIQAGASGSGSMCIQLAKHLGAQVATTIGSDEKTAFVQACGADVIINHRNENFADRVRDWTEGTGVDVVIDNVGGGVFADNLKCLKPGGAFVNFGLVGGVKDTLNFAALIFNQYRILGSMMGTLNELKDGLQLIEAGKLRPNLDRTFPLSQVAKAHEYIDSRSVQGKVVLLPWSEESEPRL
ncbi:MAG: zinc-binding dehydrogenase [Phycisphaerales bacterium]|nr:zinc-binding dehydrogenase [Phycisphaerales bacterium]